MQIKVFADLAELSRSAAALFEECARAAVTSKGSFTAALSGGSTPKGLFKLLAEHAANLPWQKMYFFWGDERHVAPDHPESNYGMARDILLSRVSMPAENIFRVPAEDPDAARAAQQYEQTLKNFFKLSPGQLPRFDLMLQGMGPDGHTASLFPGTAALRERLRLVVSNWVEKLKTERITFTAPVINNAAFILFLVSGEDKKSALEAVLEPESSPDQFPAKLIQPLNGEMLWLVDRDAAPEELRKQYA
jgi:6-phosphogluconolactonase